MFQSNVLQIRHRLYCMYVEQSSLMFSVSIESDSLYANDRMALNMSVNGRFVSGVEGTDFERG